MSTVNPANHALLTMAALGIKSLTNCAPCVVLSMLTVEELMDLRAELIDAESTAAQVRKNLDAHLAQELKALHPEN